MVIQGHFTLLSWFVSNESNETTSLS